MSNVTIDGVGIGSIVELNSAEAAVVSGGSSSTAYLANLQRQLQARMLASKLATQPAKTAKDIQQSS